MTSDGIFDKTVTQTYDRDHGGTDPALLAVTADTLAALTSGGEVGGAALEFAIGTGRIALPLQERGVKVQGIELSQAMVDCLRQKERGKPIDVAIGDMTTTRVDGQFSLVFLVFNTISNLTSQEAQIACFENAARHLDPGGRFLIEVDIPPLQRLPIGETLLAFDRTETHWGMDEFDVVTQRFSSHHVWFENEEERQLSVPFRYTWPSELDLMARLAGLELESRWADWQRAPFTKLSPSHISVWRKPE